MIRLENIKKRYNANGVATIALRGVYLEIGDGEMVAIIGPSGSGKTTLLNIIGCMDVPSAGDYFCNGVDISELNQRETEQFRKENISFVFQQFALLNDYTVYENIELPLRVKNIPGKKRKRIVRDILGRFHMEDLEKKYPTQISGGQQQRCALARAVAAGGDILLCDEPTGSLDGATGQDILNVLKALNREGKTVIIVTHDMRIAGQTQRIIRIEDGVIR